MYYLHTGPDLLRIIDRLKSSQFAKNIAVLMTGTAIAQAIPVLASPVLTRLYTPSDFGLVAIFLALVSSIAPAVCGKYEVALVLPKKQSDWVHLLGIAFQIAFTISVIFILLVFFFKDRLLILLDAPELDKWIYLAPVALLLTGLVTAMVYVANRQHQYSKIVKSKLAQALTLVAVSIGLGFTGSGFEGLLLGNLAGLLMAAVLFYYFYREILTFRVLAWRNPKPDLVKQYKNYPLFNASSSLLNGITAVMPIFFLSHLFSESIVGYFALVLRVIQTPLSIISSSISQVNLKKVVDLEYNSLAVRPYLLRLIGILVAITIVPSVILMISAPGLFALVFGEEWREAGIYLSVLMPAFLMKFIASTLSSTLGALNKNKTTAMFNVVNFSFVLAAFLAFRNVDIYLLLTVYSLVVFILYFWLLVMIIYVRK